MIMLKNFKNKILAIFLRTKQLNASFLEHIP